MNPRFLAVCALLMLAACGQAGPLYLSRDAPPPRSSELDISSDATEPAAITVPLPKPALAQPSPAPEPEAREDNTETPAASPAGDEAKP
jgi:predicted small lipoprotein YifL